MSADRVYGYSQPDGTWHFQEAPYIEDGWYIVAKLDGTFDLMEIPRLADEEQLIGNFNSFQEAYAAAKELT